MKKSKFVVEADFSCIFLACNNEIRHVTVWYLLYRHAIRQYAARGRAAAQQRRLGVHGR